VRNADVGWPREGVGADIIGCSALLGGNLKGRQAVSLPMNGELGGRIIDTAEDGMLAEFTTRPRPVVTGFVEASAVGA
jgi:hypothetical protein